MILKMDSNRSGLIYRIWSLTYSDIFKLSLLYFGILMWAFLFFYLNCANLNFRILLFNFMLNFLCFICFVCLLMKHVWDKVGNTCFHFNMCFASVIHK